MAVEVIVPGALADLVGGARQLNVELPAPATVGGLLDTLGRDHPALRRRLCDETGEVRRFVNIYVDGEDIRRAEGLATTLTSTSTVQVLPSIAGGAPRVK